MKKYTVFHIPVFSFFSMGLYRDVCHNWKGTCLAYLFLLLALCWVPTVVKLHIGLSKFVQQEAPKVLSQLPKMTINKGELTVDATQPYKIADPISKKTIIVIDTTGMTADLEGDVVCLVKKHEVIVRKSKFEKRTFDLKSIDHFYLDSNRVTGWLEIFRKYFAVCLFPLALATSYMFRILQVLIYACVGMLFASICNFKISYLPLLRLSVVAVTPCIIIRTVLEISGVRIPFVGFLFLIMTLIYLFIGVKAAARQENPQQGTENEPSQDLPLS